MPSGALSALVCYSSACTSGTASRDAADAVTGPPPEARLPARPWTLAAIAAIAGPAVVGGRCQRRRSARRLGQLRQQGTEDAGQDVAAAGRGQPGRGLGLAEDGPEGRGHQGRGALEQDGGPGQLAARRTAARVASSTPVRPGPRRSVPAARPVRRRAVSARTGGARSRGRAGSAPASATTGSPAAAASRTRSQLLIGVVVKARAEEPGLDVRSSAALPVPHTTSGQDRRTRSATSGGPR